MRYFYGILIIVTITLVLWTLSVWNPPDVRDGIIEFLPYGNLTDYDIQLRWTGNSTRMEPEIRYRSLLEPCGIYITYPWSSSLSGRETGE